VACSIALLPATDAAGIESRKTKKDKEELGLEIIWLPFSDNNIRSLLAFCSVMN